MFCEFWTWDRYVFVDIYNTLKLAYLTITHLSIIPNAAYWHLIFIFINSESFSHKLKIYNRQMFYKLASQAYLHFRTEKVGPATSLEVYQSKKIYQFIVYSKAAFYLRAGSTYLYISDDHFFILKNRRFNQGNNAENFTLCLCAIYWFSHGVSFRVVIWIDGMLAKMPPEC